MAAISARFAGLDATDEDNIDAVLSAMRQEGVIESSAVFICVVVTLTSFDDPLPGIFQGVWRGTVSTKVRCTGGFGYDPIFIDGESQLTAAELRAEKKNRISHRGQALAKLRTALSAGQVW